MLQKTEGIVIHTIQYSDTSLITKIFTADYGLISFMIKGTRGKKSSNKAVLFQPLNLLALDIYFQENKNLQSIKESRLIDNPVRIYGNMNKTSMVLFMAEVLQKLLKENDHHPALFHLLKLKIEALNNEPFHPDFHLKMLVEIANELGYGPFNNYSKEEPIFSIQDGKFIEHTIHHSGVYYLSIDDSLNLHQILNGDPLMLQREQRRSLLTELIKYFQFHNPGMHSIQSVAILQEVL